MEVKNLPNPKDPKKKSHNPLPKFGGAKGMDEETFVKARDDYQAAMTRYRELLLADNVAQVDKVGTPKQDPTAGQ